MSKTVRVRFLRTYQVKDEEGRVFEEGTEHEMTPDSAQHFVSRGAAERVEPASKTKAKKSDDAPE